MSQQIGFAVAGEIATLTLQRPEAGNRLSNEMAASVVAALRQAEGSRLLLLRGAGTDFCLGRDMQPPPPRPEWCSIL